MRRTKIIENCCFEIKAELGDNKQPDEFSDRVIMKACKKHKLGFDHIKLILGL